MQQYTGQDWEPVIFKKKPDLSLGKNKQNNQKQYVEEEIEKKPTISLSNSKLIQQTRLLKKISQKDLANKISKDVRTIQRYESGKAVPERDVMLKIEKALEIKLNKKQKQ